MFNAEPLAQRGAQFLDEVRPGWWEDINVHQFTMHSRNICVLGQLYGSYGAGKRALELSDDDILRYGFDIRGHGDSFVLLTEYWKKEIADRQPQAA